DSIGRSSVSDRAAATIFGQELAPIGGHHARHAAPESRQMRRIALAVIAPIAVVTLAAMIWLWPSDGHAAEHAGRSSSTVT
ncbi:MAG: hypothetical protein ABIR39_24345, partial [Nocardioides sp.]|uniref:hypothetical protein n=1 Tax=Nocardioides sp. TaxID=35761 RepID=UPI00326560E3